MARSAAETEMALPARKRVIREKKKTVDKTERTAVSKNLEAPHRSTGKESRDRNYIPVGGITKTKERGNFFN